MKVDSAILRRLIPAGAVLGVIAFSYFAQAPSLASNNDVGYGYRNNCGVKGDGFHDHGKACPNRPFPGKGEGVEEIIGDTTATTTSSADSNAESQSEINATAGVTAGSANGDTTRNPGKGHGHDTGRGRKTET